MVEATWPVGRVAKRAGVAISTLHFYEQKGLIKSWRNAGNQRRYKPDVLRRIAVIKVAQRVGVSLEEIRLALSQLPDNRTPTKEDWSQLSSQWHQALDERIRALTALRDMLTGCIGCGCLSLASCPIYNPDDELGQGSSGPVILSRQIKPSTS